MNGRIGGGLERYADLVEDHPVKVLAVALLVSMVLAAGASKVETVEMSQEDILPDSMPTMEAFNTITAEFGSRSGTSYTILVETAPRYPDSTEVRDLRNPQVLRFLRSISNDIQALNDVRSVSGPSDLFKEIPSSRDETREAFRRLGKVRWSNYVTGDYTAARIQVESFDISAEEQVELARTIRRTVRVHDKPAGLEITYTGQPYIDEAFQQQTQKTMQLTGLVAVIGVIGVVVFLFRSLFYGGTSLLTLVFGIATGFGIFGYLGLDMSPATSGALTMGIGVAIDFGIQPIARYIEEREDLGIEKSMEETVKGVFTPMTIGLIAANIGFLSLNVGRVTFLSSLGTLLTLTTTMAYISAFTVIPASLVVYDRYFTVGGTSGFTLSKILSNDSEGDT
ncbi:MAG: MMPL family transporter [Candidatus Nanohaloarchaea archaeon]